MNIERQLKDAITAAARRLEVELKADSHKLRTLGAELINDLALAYGEPGFEEAAVAARDILALELGIEATEAADLADAEMRGLVLGFLISAAGTAV